METPHLIYFADPMCSWCYGFSPVIGQIRQAFGRSLPIRLVMGGLRPGTDTPTTDKAKAELVGHWGHVHEATGLPFDGAVLDRPGFLYDTDPAARAVVRVRREDPEKALVYLGRVQQAFYAQNQDVTKPETLADLAAELGVDREAFLADFETDDLKHETWADYGTSQRAGVTGFPTLVAGPSADGTYGVVTRGYQPAEQVLPLLHRWMGTA
ncbi:DsbA family protein [Phenylobacterium sp. LH3H17]|uniref:DsbA family protein n=1 Tax=Phenylobacterium sp. LH3H17 TaxID=2903901 RepID=UPI0020C9FC4F|nr:DsbA family protein [Phenylobacterium sp. LH3H17]UTP38632.1 DsbA family protein [Phenylobacterium sp. LH3H17]